MAADVVDLIRTETCHVYMIKDWCKADKLYEYCLELPWIVHQFPLHGRICKQGRLSMIASVDAVPYRYARASHPAEDIAKFPILENIMAEVNAFLGTEFNSILLNFYRDGNDYISNHSDDERDLSKSIVAGISLGVERTFRMVNKETGEKVDFELPDSSLFVMAGDTQKEWTHGLPVRKKIKEGRISLTFREFK